MVRTTGGTESTPVDKMKKKREKRAGKKYIMLPRCEACGVREVTKKGLAKIIVRVNEEGLGWRDKHVLYQFSFYNVTSFTILWKINYRQLKPERKGRGGVDDKKIRM